MYIKTLPKREGRERHSRTHERRPYKNKNVNMEVNSNDMDSHGIKTMYSRSYPRQKMMSIIINTYQKDV